jgi:hypothetical protein
MQSGKFSQKFAIIGSIGLIPTMAFFLLTRYKVKGCLDKIDWAIATLAIIIGSTFLFVKTHLNNRKKKGSKRE